jgi:hypothetical protein
VSKILIVGDSASSKLRAFALKHEFEVVVCGTQEAKDVLDKDLILRERQETKEEPNWTMWVRKIGAKGAHNKRPTNFDVYYVPEDKKSPTKQQRREWRRK